MYKLVAIALIAISLVNAQTTSSGTTNSGTTSSGTTNSGTTSTGTTSGTTTTGTTTTTTTTGNTKACPNDEYCLACSSANKCTSCAGSYADANGICQVPTTKVSNCLSYSSATACAACNQGYYLNNNACTTINVTNCAYVNPTAATTCIGCENSKLAGTTGNCDGATCTLSNCSICNTNTKCLECNSKYSLNTDGTCVSEPTANCANSSGSACTICEEGYYASSGSCKESSVQGNATIFSAIIALLAFVKLIA